jgi:hypothetical protein
LSEDLFQQLLAGEAAEGKQDFFGVGRHEQMAANQVPDLGVTGYFDAEKT